MNTQVDYEKLNTLELTPSDDKENGDFKEQFLRVFSGVEKFWLLLGVLLSS